MRSHRCVIVGLAAMTMLSLPLLAVTGSADQGLRSDSFWLRAHAINNGGTAHLQQQTPGGGFQSTGCLGDLGRSYQSSTGFQLLGGICAKMHWFLGGGATVSVLFPEVVIGTTLGVPAPNPSDGPVQIGFALAEGQKGTIRIFDPTGRLVRTLVDDARGPLSAGARWDLGDESGRRVSPGVYFARLEAGSVTASRKLIVLGH